ncbi:MAG: nitrite reductase [Gammaproteobacteria bacterium]|nr:nitrite reductase [Gammaproteobacteria bacterium]
MNTLFYVVCIVAIVFTAETIQKYMKMKNEEKRALDPELEETLAQIERLEERIKVLERIVTENKYDLSQEISNLK